MMTTVKVSNVSLGATDRDLKEFFSFSGDILYLETQRFALHFSTFLFFSFFTLFFYHVSTARQNGPNWRMSLSRIYKELKLLFFSRYVHYFSSPLYHFLFMFFNQLMSVYESFYFREQRLLILQSLSLWLLITNCLLRL